MSLLRSGTTLFFGTALNTQLRTSVSLPDPQLLVLTVLVPESSAVEAVWAPAGQKGSEDSGPPGRGSGNGLLRISVKAAAGSPDLEGLRSGGTSRYCDLRREFWGRAEAPHWSPSPVSSLPHAAARDSHKMIETCHSGDSTPTGCCRWTPGSGVQTLHHCALCDEFPLLSLRTSHLQGFCFCFPH